MFVHKIDRLEFFSNWIYKNDMYQVFLIACEMHIF